MVSQTHTEIQLKIQLKIRADTVVSVLTTGKLQFITEQDRSESYGCHNCLKNKVASIHHWEIFIYIFFKVPTMLLDKFIHLAYCHAFSSKPFDQAPKQKNRRETPSSLILKSVRLLAVDAKAGIQQLPSCST